MDSQRWAAGAPRPCARRELRRYGARVTTARTTARHGPRTAWRTVAESVLPLMLVEDSESHLPQCAPEPADSPADGP